MAKKVIQFVSDKEIQTFTEVSDGYVDSRKVPCNAEYILDKLIEFMDKHEYDRSAYICSVMNGVMRKVAFCNAED